MQRWDLAIALEESAQPIFLQIADAIVLAVRSGRLKPGDKLPSSRTLAASLKVNRHTVTAAFDELMARGWVTARGTGGTFIAADPPPASGTTALRTPSDAIGFAWRPGSDVTEVPRALLGVLNLSDGVADPRLLPVDLVSRAYARSLRLFRRDVLGFGDPQGFPRLREVLADGLRLVRGVATSPERVMITQGSQQALHLLARALVQPGEAIAVERWGNPAVWRAFREAGADLVPIDVDDEGLVVGHLAEVLRQRPLRALFVTPLYQFPTQVTLSPARRKQLVDLAHAHRLAILEGDFDHEYTYEGVPPLSLAAEDPYGVVLVVGSLAKLMAPGFRMGYVAAPRPVIQRLVELRAASDRQGDQVLECAVSELMNDRTLDRHQEHVQQVYGQRRAVLSELLRTELGGLVTYRRPPGGTALWLEGLGVDVDEWLLRARQAGVLAHAASHYALDGRAEPFFRLSFAALSAEELAIAIAKLKQAFP